VSDRDAPSRPDCVCFVYRCLSPNYRNKQTDKPKPTAFHLRDGEPSLSVFADKTSIPRQRLQAYLDGVNADPDQERAEKKRIANGRTPEEMYDAGWRVARVPIALVEELGLMLGEMRESDGHMDITADHPDHFVRAADALVEGSEILPKEDTLRR
jgi:hypothetical protein